MGKPHYKLPVSVMQTVPVGAGMMSGAHDAASLSDHTLASWMPPAGSADTDLIPELDILVPRARDLHRNNGFASGAVQTLKDNIIGSQIRLSAKPDIRILGWDREAANDWSSNVESWYRTWANTTECDAGRSMSLLGLTVQALGGAIVNGDAIGIVHWLPRSDAMWGTRLQVVEADRLQTPPHLSHRDDIRGGVEVDKYGAPIAYWIRKHHPGDALGRLGFIAAVANASDFERIPAFTKWGRRRVIHLHDKERSGQSRGKPVVTAVMKEFRNLGKFSDAKLKSAIVNALVAAFVESDLDPQSIADMFTTAARDGNTSVQDYWRNSVGAYRTTLQGGAVIPLPLGAKVSAFNPGQPDAAFEPFMRNALRQIAAGMNIPYELLAKDFSQSNYSSARAALLEAWRFFQSRRRWLIDYWLNPIYELWFEEAANTGRVSAPDYYQKKSAYLGCRWVFSGRGWVDPVKEAQAAGLRMHYGLSTLEAECAEQGEDWEEVVEQRAREKRVLEENGLQPEAGLAKKPTAVMGMADEKEEDGNNKEEAVSAVPIGMSIDQLGLSIGTVKALATAGITTTEQLVPMTASDLLAVPGIGRARLEEIMSAAIPLEEVA